MARTAVKPIYSPRDKASPAYRKSLEIEISTLRRTLQDTQNQASVLQNTCNTLQSDNKLLKWRADDNGLTAVFKDVALVIGGVAIPYFIDEKYALACILFLIVFALIFVRFILGHFRKDKP